MAEEQDNLVLHILREMRDEARRTSDRLGGIERRLGKIEHETTAIKETLAYSAGLALHANVNFEKMVEQESAVRGELDDLRARIAALEARQ